MTPIEALELLGGTLAKGAVILLAARGAVRLLRGRSAASRYAVWCAAFAALLLLPALTLSLPPLDTLTPGEPQPVPPAARAVPSPPVPPEPAPAHAIRHTPATAMEFRPTQDAMWLSDPAPRRSAWARASAPWLVGAWLAGVLLAVGLLVRDVRRIARLTRRAAPLRQGPLYELGHQVAAELGACRPVLLALSRELTMPVSWGLVRPVVLLPAAARRWDTERQRVVLRHELAHVRRRDYAGHLLIELACALHWPNPFAWRSARLARLEQEQACDDRVLGLGTRSVEYAEHLLEIARAFTPAMAERGALAMAATGTLRERMRAILDARLDRRPAGRRTLTAVTAAALLVGVPTAALHPWTTEPREAELAAGLRSPSPAVRRDAVWALAVRGSSRSREAITARLGDADPATRGVAAWALGKLGDLAAVAPLIGALRDSDANVREMAVLALGDLGDPRAVPALALLAADPEHGVRSVMTVALKHIGGEPAAEALAGLVRSDPDAHTRVMAAGALGQVEGRVRLPALEAALGDSAAEVRANAASALERIGNPAAVPALLSALSREPDLEASDAMVHALGAAHDPRATEGIVHVLADSLPQLRESAAKMLGMLGDDRAVEPLMLATRDPDHRVRLTAVWALDELQHNR